MATLSLNYVLLIAIPILVVLTLVITFLLVVLLKRKSKNSSSSSSSSNSTSSTSFRKSIIDKSQISNAIDIGYSPADVRSCIYAGGKLIYSAALKERKRGGQVFTYKELELATDGFSPENVIGNGGFGVVFRGTLRDGTEAAIKVLHREGKQGEREFRMEVDLLSRLHSCYLVALLGYCADQQHRLLVFEFLPNGSLQGHLHPAAPCKQHRRRAPLDWCTRLRIALDCARGLEFLHERMNPAVIHRDFKCSNILLDHNFSAKVSDFGMAKTASDKVNGQVMTRVLGTSGYVAPEYASTGRLTTKSDVYSYGVVLLELLTGRVPVDSTRPPGEHALVSWALPRLTNREKVMEMVDPTLQGQYSKKDLIQVAAIAAVCVQSEAEYRPLITDVVQSLIPLVKSQDSMSSRYHHQIVVPVS
ncbi:putative serine/threonine-protein kinase PBL7 isoform X1 [Iris pallida]|uniref:Serine/threonine-protein kinase PBL7 isoform X1 n=1 Tax=Iris pallida TaxID=29817 RepID=A0AAX6DR27_IRIPA|nr:putative serine/threonine-protein kinase PBL7 isoform X1 [Iris pallida]